MDPVGSLDALTIDCADPLELARFWSAVFGTEIDSTLGDEPHYVDLRPVPGVPVLRFQRVPDHKTTKNRLHLDMLVEDLDQARASVEALGGRKAPVQPVTEYGWSWIVMQDPEGNEFCLGTSASGGA
jgi:predicted enzyme related to lactoylglutathione lyase